MDYIMFIFHLWGDFIAYNDLLSSMCDVIGTLQGHQMIFSVVAL